MLSGKNIILGVTGSIAAYKAAMLTRLFVKEGASVKVLMTPLAKEFVAPLTFATLSKNPVLTEFYNPENGDWNSHVDLGAWADVYVIAPATANTMAKMAHGIADNLLLTTYLSARCPVVIAPAMDLDMYNHPTTQNNIAILKRFGNTLIEPATGELASGLSGKGRMEGPEFILEVVKKILVKKKRLNKRFLVTAGPTYEPIDPVRFIGNHSSGKMGYAIAETLAGLGAEVTLVSGPVSVGIQNPDIQLVQVGTAEEMFNATVSVFDKVDCAIFCAAVADYSPAHVAQNKIKRQGKLTLGLKPTRDIAAFLGKRKKKGQVLVGFALETENETENALLKLKNKNLDLIVLNSLNDPGAGFQSDLNKVSIIGKNGAVANYELQPKTAIARHIVDHILPML